MTAGVAAIHTVAAADEEAPYKDYATGITFTRSMSFPTATASTTQTLLGCV